MSKNEYNNCKGRQLLKFTKDMSKMEMNIAYLEISKVTLVILLKRQYVSKICDFTLGEYLTLLQIDTKRF